VSVPCDSSECGLVLSSQPGFGRGIGWEAFGLAWIWRRVVSASVFSAHRPVKLIGLCKSSAKTVQEY